MGVDAVDQGATSSGGGRGGTLARRLARVLRPGRHAGIVDARRRARAALVEITRLTAASVAAFLLVVAVTGERTDLTGALTALLVVQATTYSTLKMGVVRVGAVLTGVMVAVLLTNWFGLTWWSLGAAIFLSLVMGRVLRLGDQMLETPISAMLILAVHGAQVAVETRVTSTLLGAAVGMGFGLFFAPVVPARRAAGEVRALADTVGDILAGAAARMIADRVQRDDVSQWLDATRGTGHRSASASAIVAEVADSRRFNVWAVGRPSGEPTLRGGLDVVDGVVRGVAALFTVLARELPAEDSEETAFDEAIRPAFAVVLDTMADAVRAFGRLLEAEFGGGEEDVETSFAESLDGLRESRAMLTDLMLMDPVSGREQWLLRGSVLSAVEETLRQLDVLEQLRRERAERARQPRISMRVGAEAVRGIRLVPSQRSSTHSE